MPPTSKGNAHFINAQRTVRKKRATLPDENAYHFPKSMYLRNSSTLFFILYIFLYLKFTLAIMNHHAPLKDASAASVSKQLGSRYLNQQRPLWILEDQVPQNDNNDWNYATQVPCSYQMHLKQTQQQQQQQQQRQPTRQQNRSVQRQSHAMPPPPKQQFKRAFQFADRQRPQRPLTRPLHFNYAIRLRNPHQYMHPRRVQFEPRFRHKQPRFVNTKVLTRAHRRREHYIPRFSMPTFDSLPGDENLGEAPVFIYTGPKGAIILNTMLSASKYPMQEPVPGQVLYPPSVPIFRPKPIVERFRMPDTAKMLNLTLIPFYEHEAMDIRQASRMLTPTDVLSSEESTTAQPTVLYEAPAITSTIADSAAAESKPPAKKWRMKKGKHYSAYHSPNEVQWTPIKSEQLKLLTSTTTPYPLTAPSPPQNHRFTTTADTINSSTAPSPSFSNYKISYKSDSDSVENTVDKSELLVDGNHLGIIYVDDSLEKPSTAATTTPKVSSRYSLSKEYYAFPVFTLGKLLKKEMVETEKQPQSPPVMVENTTDKPMAYEEAHEADSDSREGEVAGENDENDVETWFILNSRYKGQHSPHNNEYRLSSKYIHTTEVREPNETNS